VRLERQLMQQPLDTVWVTLTGLEASAPAATDLAAAG
jgi:hypothetical protein